MSLRYKTFSGVRWTAVSSFGKTAVQMIQIAVLARLLTPNDFGLMALVSTTIVFTQIVADMGISNAIIHYKDINQKQLSSLYWSNIAIGFSLWIFLAIISPLIAVFYDEACLRPLLVLAGSSFLIYAIGQQIRVVAEKNLHFAGLAKIEICAALLGLITSILMAIQGYGVYSLVGGQIISALCTTLLLWLFIADGWRPHWHFNFSEVRLFLNFGSYVVGTNFISTLNWQIDIIIGGHLFGSSVLGAYNAPRELCLRVASVINPIVTRVGLPLMAKVHSDAQKLKSIYLKTISMTAAVNFPIYLIFFSFAPELVRLILGTQWNTSIPFMRVFALWGLFRSVGNPLGSLVYAAGRPDISLRWTIFQTAIIIPLTLITSRYGALSLAYAMFGIVIILLLTSWRFIVSPLTGTGFFEFHRILCTPLILSTLSTFIAWLIIRPLHNDLLRLSIFLLVAGILYFLLSRRFNRSWIEAMHELLLQKSQI